MQMAFRRVDVPQVRLDLAESTAELFPVTGPNRAANSALRRRYLAEGLRLSNDLDAPLASLVSYMKFHDPQFFEGVIRLNIPAVD